METDGNKPVVLLICNAPAIAGLSVPIVTPTTDDGLGFPITIVVPAVANVEFVVAPPNVIDGLLSVQDVTPVVVIVPPVNDAELPVDVIVGTAVLFARVTAPPEILTLPVMVIAFECVAGTVRVPPETIKSPIPKEPDVNDGNNKEPLVIVTAPLEKLPDVRFGNVIVPVPVDWI
jgi:hypothetical protein